MFCGKVVPIENSNNFPRHAKRLVQEWVAIKRFWHTTNRFGKGAGRP